MQDGSDPLAVAASVQAQTQYVFTHAIRGFAGSLDATQLKKLGKHPAVLHIEAEQLVTTADTQVLSDGEPWGIDRIDQIELPLDRAYSYVHDGTGALVYVLDTGLDFDHPDFVDAEFVFDAFGGNGEDCRGHGTHVAGTIAGQRYGVAKGASLRIVRVLGCNGSGSSSGVIAGMDAVIEHHAMYPDVPAIVNMSLGGNRSAAIDAAVARLTQSGVVVVVSAGNSSKDACNYSPAGADEAITVAASDRSDKRASFSNHGPCVELYAPGVGIWSDSLNGGTQSLSGTSMSAPHVTGAAALYMVAHPEVSAGEIATRLQDEALLDKIAGNRKKTPNLLLHVGFNLESP